MLVCLRCRADSADNRGKLKIRQTSVAIVTDENAGLTRGYPARQKQPKENTYPIQVPVYYGVVHVKIIEAFRYVQQLGRITLSVKCGSRRGLTRPIRVTTGFLLTNSIRVPFGIHSEMTCKGSVVTPTKGTTFGCLSLFQMTACLENDYTLGTRAQIPTGHMVKTLRLQSTCDSNMPSDQMLSTF